MILVENQKNMKIYKNMETYLPTLSNDKKKGATITLLSPSYEASKFLMNHPLFKNNKRYESYYIDRDVSFLIGNKKIEEVEEAAINEMKRSELPDSAFGIPEDRKFPLDTEQHVRSAIKLFGHASDSKKKSLAKKIASRAKKYGIDIPETTQVYKYLHEETILEDDDYINEYAYKTVDDMYYNFEAFENSDTNVLFITGYSGGGKSTLARELSAKYKAEIIELDDIFRPLKSIDRMKETSNIIQDFYKTPIGRNYLKMTLPKDGAGLLDQTLFITIDFLDWFFKKNYSKSKKYIIEGIQLMLLIGKGELKPEYFKKYSFILKGTSNIESIKRSGLRDYNKKLVAGTIGNSSAEKKEFMDRRMSIAKPYIDSNSQAFNATLKIFEESLILKEDEFFIET